MDDSKKLPQPEAAVDLYQLTTAIKAEGKALGFQAVGISNIDLAKANAHTQQWLSNQYQGEMDYMVRNIDKRAKPELLVPGTLSIISARMDYRLDVRDSDEVLGRSELGFISRYALGRDYHKIMRKRLQRLADFVSQQVAGVGYRVFVDSAPVLEKAIAEKAGLGWIGKHTNLLHRDAGSWFFLGEIFTTLLLPSDSAVRQHCGDCRACIDVCPTQAIVAPYQLDARRCISYLTIELRGSIPPEFRPMMGNRIYGCDDCQLVCPWNRFAKFTSEQDFLPRQGLDAPQLVALFAWTEDEFLRRLEGSPIRRIGHECWLRNIAVALGNGPKTDKAVEALQCRLNHPSEMVKEHVVWALGRLTSKN